jgi:hypothetical protein
VTIGAVRPYTTWRSFGMGRFAYWALGKPAMAKERDTIKEPNRYQDWERFMERLYELSRRSGEEFERLFTDEELLEYIEEECFVGDEASHKGIKASVLSSLPTSENRVNAKFNLGEFIFHALW